MYKEGEQLEYAEMVRVRAKPAPSPDTEHLHHEFPLVAFFILNSEVLYFYFIFKN